MVLEKDYFGGGRRRMLWKRAFCQTESIGWGSLSDPVSLTVMLCIGSLFLTQMLFITAETHCLTQVILIYATFQDTAWLNRRWRPWNLTKGTTSRLQAPNFDLLSPISFWNRIEVANSRENMPTSCVDWFIGKDYAEKWREKCWVRAKGACVEVKKWKNVELKGGKQKRKREITPPFTFMDSKHLQQHIPRLQRSHQASRGWRGPCSDPANPVRTFEAIT